MNEKPLVSIITPCYNSESYLSRYLDSILEQTYDNIELVLVNDGSKDNTEGVIFDYKDKIEQKGYKLVYVKQENQGIGGAINNGLKHVSGEYFAWCDSDNFYSSDYVEAKVKLFLEKPEYSIVRCDGYAVYENDITKPVAKMSAGNTDLYQEHMFENCLFVKNFHFGCAMLKTADFDKVNPTREIYPSREGQNWQLLLPMFYHYKSAYIDKPMFYFVFRQNSVSNITKILPVQKSIDQSDEYERIIINTLLSMGIPDEEKYVEAIKLKYQRRRVQIYAERKARKEMKREYRKLKEQNGVDLKTKLVYLSGKNWMNRIFIKSIWEIRNRIVSIVRKKKSKKL